MEREYRGDGMRSRIDVVAFRRRRRGFGKIKLWFIKVFIVVVCVERIEDKV